MASTPDYYKTLGVPAPPRRMTSRRRSANSPARITLTRGGDEAKFKEINEAYEVLGDEKKRALYDQYGTANENQIPRGWSGGQGFSVDDISAVRKAVRASGSWSDILESIRRGEGAFGSELGLRRRFRRIAPPSSRSGHERDAEGLVRRGVPRRREARDRADSRKPASDTVTVKVPAGAVDGGRLRFSGKGGLSQDGGEPGDLLVTTKIEPHPYYRRDKADVIVDVPVTVAEAALGAAIVVPAPDGTKVRVRIPAGTQDGAVLTIKGKGAPDVKSKGSFGNLKIQVDVKVPKTMNEKQRRAMEDFLAATTEDVRTWE